MGNRICRVKGMVVFVRGVINLLAKTVERITAEGQQRVDVPWVQQGKKQWSRSEGKEQGT